MLVADSSKHFAFWCGSCRCRSLWRIENIKEVHILDSRLFDHREMWIVIWCRSCGPIPIQGVLVADCVGRSSLHRLAALTLRLPELVPIPSERF